MNCSTKTRAQFSLFLFKIDVFPDPHFPHKLIVKLSVLVYSRIAFASYFENSVRFKQSYSFLSIGLSE